MTSSNPLPYASAPSSSPNTRRHILWKPYLRGVFLLVLSGLLLTLSFPNMALQGGSFWFLAPFALVPFSVCILRRPLNFRWLLIYYLFAFVWFFLNLFWLWPVTIAGTLALSAFIALYWMLFAFGTRRLITHLRWPGLFVIPLVWTTTEFLRATVFSGFAWYLLGNTFAGCPLLLQIADLGGVWLISFFIAMTSGLIIDLLRLPLFTTTPTRQFSPILKKLIFIYAATVIFVLAYGIFRTHQAIVPEELQTPDGYIGPRVAVIQDYIPQDQKDSPDDAAQDHFFQRYYNLSQQAASQQPDLIIWPETMVPSALNPEFLTLPVRTAEAQAYIDRGRQFDARLKQLAAQTHARLLVGAPFLDYSDFQHFIRQNASYLYIPTPNSNTTAPATQPIATQYPFHYAKRYLVPFGEYVPFREAWPALHQFLLNLTPYSYDYSITPGDSWQRFSVATRHNPPYVFTFGTPICYEDVMPYPARNFVDPANQRKQTNFLATITNDGWYHSRDELEQHRQMAQVRAVENRVPIARSVNGGTSGFIDSNGYITATVTNNNQTHFVPGFAVQTLKIDRRVSLYSRLGDFFPVICGLITALSVAWTLVRPRHGKTAPTADSQSAL